MGMAQIAVALWLSKKIKTQSILTKWYEQGIELCYLSGLQLLHAFGTLAFFLWLRSGIGRFKRFRQLTQRTPRSCQKFGNLPTQESETNKPVLRSGVSEMPVGFRLIETLLAQEV